MMWEYKQILGIYGWPIISLFTLLTIWSLIWKGVALWKAARLKDKWWYIALLVVNTAGILEIIYIYFFSKKKGLIATIKFYRNYLSPYKLQCCRFYPSCSEYTIDAIEKYGIFFGILKGLRRILRCHPLSPGGYDPA